MSERSVLADAAVAKAGRPRVRATGLSLLLALAAPLGGCSSSGTAEPVAAPARPSGPEVARALQDLERALRAGDGPAAALLAAPGADGAAARLTALADNAGSLGLASLRVGPADQGADAVWLTVPVRWRVPGVDPHPLTSTLRLRMAAQGPGARVSTVDVDGQAPLWLQGPVAVARAGDVVVVVAGAGAADARARLSEAEAASRHVRRVLPHWTPRLAVEVPGDAASYAAVLDVQPGERAADAAVTTTVGDPTTSGSLRVVLNPEVYPAQSPRGERVVLAHEATHVALSAAASDLPLWLVEGFADYVALRDVGVPLRRSATELTAWVRQHGPLPRLPGDGWFTSAGDRRAAAYQASWLACLAVADRVGERALVRFYRLAARTRDPDGALHQVVALSRRRLAEAVTERVSNWTA